MTVPVNMAAQMREISQGPTPRCRTTENPRLLRENYISSWIRSLAWIMVSLITWNIFYQFFLHSLFVGFYIQPPSASSGGWISGFCSPFPAQVPVSTSIGPSVNLREGVCKTNNFTIGKTCSPVFPRRSCLKFSLQCCTKSNDFGFSSSLSTPPVQDYLSKIGDKFRNNISRTTVIFSKIIRKLVFTFQ